MNNEREHDGQRENNSAKPSSSKRNSSSARTGSARRHSFNGTSAFRRGEGHNSSAGTLSIGFVLGVVRQWWKVAAPLGLLLAAIGAGTIWWMFEPVYEAQAWLRIEDRQPYIAYPQKGDSRRFISTQIALIRSPRVIKPVVSVPEVAKVPEIANAKDPIRWLGSRVKVKSIGNSELFAVSFASPNKDDAATVANAVVESFMEYRGSYKRARALTVLDLLGDEQRLRKLRVQELRDSVQKMTKEATGMDPYAAIPPAQYKQDPLSALELKLSDAEVKRTIAEVRVKALEKSVTAMEFDIPDAVIRDAVDEDPDVMEVKAAINAKIETLGRYEVALVGAKNHPKYVRLAQEMEDDKGRLDRLRQQVQQAIRSEMRSGWQSQRAAELAQLQAQVDDYKLLEQSLQTICNENLKTRKESGSISLDLEFMRVELARAEEVHDRIADRIALLETEFKAPNRVEIDLPATAPAMPVEVLPIKKISVISLALFALPFCMAVAWEMLVRRVSDADRLEKDAQLPVIGEIARLPTRHGRSYGFGHRDPAREMDVFEEGVDSLRTSLVLAESLEDMRVILVTSAVSSEGKTSVAVQLAVSLARASGKRTLLVDADMRAPDIHGLLDLPLEPGLADVLSGDSTLDEAVKTEFSDSIHVLTAGHAHTSPHRLVGNGTLRPMFDEFREKYDYVVIDSPPVLAVSEALVLARQADASLICAMRDNSRVDQVRRAFDRLVGAGARPEGVVLNGVPVGAYARRYGTYGYVGS